MSEINQKDNHSIEIDQQSEEESAFSSDSSVANQLARKADWALEDGEATEAAALFRQALDLDPDYKYAKFGLAQAYVELDKPNDALPLLESLTDEYPDEVEFKNELGLALMDLKRTDEAIATFEAVLAIDPYYPAPHANLGSLWEDLGEDQKAVDAFETYLEWSDDPEESEEIEGRIEDIQRRIQREERRARRERSPDSV